MADDQHTRDAGQREGVNPASPVAAQMHVSGGPLLNLFVRLALLWSVVKIPSMMRRYVLKGGGSNNIGSFVVRACWSGN